MRHALQLLTAMGRLRWELDRPTSFTPLDTVLVESLLLSRTSLGKGKRTEVRDQRSEIRNNYEMCELREKEGGWGCAFAYFECFVVQFFR